jgi:hypothetical protein
VIKFVLGRTIVEAVGRFLGRFVPRWLAYRFFFLLVELAKRFSLPTSLLVLLIGLELYFAPTIEEVIQHHIDKAVRTLHRPGTSLLLTQADQIKHGIIKRIPTHAKTSARRPQFQPVSDRSSTANGSDDRIADTDSSRSVCYLDCAILLSPLDELAYATDSSGNIDFPSLGTPTLDKGLISTDLPFPHDQVCDPPLGMVMIVGDFPCKLSDR